MIGMTDGRIVFDGTADRVTNDVLSAIYGGEAWMR